MTTFTRMGAAFSTSNSIGASVNVAQNTRTNGDAAGVGAAFAKPRGLINGESFGSAQNRAFDAAGQGLDTATKKVGETFSSLWGWATGIKLGNVEVGKGIEAVGSGVGQGLTWMQEEVWNPTLDYYEAYSRYSNSDTSGQNPLETTALMGVGILPFAGNLSENFRENYYNPTTENEASLHQVTWELGRRNFGGVEMERDANGAPILPLIDDPSLRAERAAYFSQGPQRFVTGALDIASSIALDPTLLASAGVSATVRGATRLTAEGVEAAAKTSRGAAAEAAKFTPEALGALNRTQLRAEAAAVGVTGASKMTKPNLIQAIQDSAAGQMPAVGRAVGETDEVAERLGLSAVASRGLATNTMKISDYVLDFVKKADTDVIAATKAEDAAGGALSTGASLEMRTPSGLIASIAKDKVLGQSAEAGALARVLVWIPTIVKDEKVALGLMDDVQLALAGSEEALGRVSRFSAKLEYDLRVLRLPDTAPARQGLLQDPRIPYAEALGHINNDGMFARFKAVAADDVRRGFDEIKRVEAEGLFNAPKVPLGGPRLHAAGTINKVPLRTSLANGMGIAKTIKPTRYGPVVHLLQGLRLPNTIHHEGPAATEEFTQHITDTIRALGGKNANPKAVEVLNRYLDEYMGARVPGSRADLGTAVLGRKDVFERAENAAYNAVIRNRVERMIADPKNPLTRDDAVELQRQISTWADEYIAARKAQIEAMQSTADRVVKSSNPEQVALGDGSNYAMGLDTAQVSSHASGRTFRADWGKLNEFLERKFEFNKDYNTANFTRERIAETARGVMDEANSAMKFALLLRPIAYPLRVQADTQARLIMNLGVMNYAVFAAKGLGNRVINQRRVAADVGELYAVKLRAHFDRDLAAREHSYRGAQLREAELAVATAKRRKKPVGDLRERLEDIKAAQARAAEDLAEQQRLIDLDLKTYRGELLERANRPRKQQIAEATAHIEAASARLAKLRATKRPGQYTLDRIRSVEKDIARQERMIAQAREAWQHTLPVAKVKRGKTALKRVQGHSGTMDLRTGAFVEPKRLDAYERSPFEIEALLQQDQRLSTHNLYMESSKEYATSTVTMHRNVRTYGATPEQQAAYNQTYAAMVNQHIRGDQAFEALLHGADPESVVEWMRKTPEGRDYYRSLGGGDPELLHGGPEDLVGQQLAILDDLLPEGLRQRARARDLTVEEIEDFWDEATGQLAVAKAAAEGAGVSGPAKGAFLERPEILVEDRVVNQLIPFPGNAGSAEAIMGTYRNLQRKYFRNVSEIPEMFLGRHPMYKTSFDNRVNQLLESRGLTREAAEKTVGLDEINAIRAEASRMARKDMLNVMFDTSKQTNLQHSVRWLIPFYSAWEDVMVKWSRIVGQNPYAGVAMARGFESLTSVANAYDKDGNIILENGEVHAINPQTGEINSEVLYHATPNDGFLVWNLPSQFASATGVGTLKFNRGSLNSVFQGENPFLPGAGPFVAIPTNEIIKNGLPFIPMDNATWMTETPGVKNFVEWALPYGQTSDSAQWQAAPTWARNFITMVGSLTGAPNGGAVSAFDQLMVQQMNAERLGLTPVLTDAERDAKVRGQMQFWWFTKFIGSELPVSTQPGSRLDFYRNEFHRYREEFGGDAEERFHLDYPEAKEVTTAWTMNNAGISASEDAQAAVQPWRDAIAQAPGTGFIYAGPANYLGEFSDAVYEVQKSQTISPDTDVKFRSNRPIATAGETIALEQGWTEWSKFNHLLDGAMIDAGAVNEAGEPVSLNSRAGAEWGILKDAYLEKLKRENPTWAQEYSKGFSAGENPPVYAMSKVYTALVQNPDKIRTSGQESYYMSILGYVEARNAMRQEMLAQGFGSADSKEFKTSELGILWTAYVNRTKTNSPAFADVYYRAGWDRDDLVDEVVVN